MDQSHAEGFIDMFPKRICTFGNTIYFLRKAIERQLFAVFPRRTVEDPRDLLREAFITCSECLFY